MTRDDVIRLAREAGDDVEHTLTSDLDFLERFANLVAAAERKSLRRCGDRGEDAMTEITHQILWSSRSEKEHELIMRECERATSLGGSFKIENKYTDNWYSFITIYYPETKP